MLHELCNSQDVERFVDRTADDTSTSALIAAVEHGRVDATKALLAAGANVNHADAQGRTALMHAASNLDSTLFVPLLDAGADASLKASNGWTALLFACGSERDSGACEAVEKLVDCSEARGKERNDLELQAALGMARKMQRLSVAQLLEDMINDEDGLFTPR